MVPLSYGLRVGRCFVLLWHLRTPKLARNTCPVVGLGTIPVVPNRLFTSSVVAPASKRMKRQAAKLVLCYVVQPDIQGHSGCFLPRYVVLLCSFCGKICELSFLYFTVKHSHISCLPIMQCGHEDSTSQVTSGAIKRTVRTGTESGGTSRLLFWISSHLLTRKRCLIRSQ